MDYTLLKRLVNINTHSNNPEGLKKGRLLLEDAFAPLKAKKTVKGDTLFFSKRPNAPIKIFLGGHYDTVYPIDQPFQKLTKPSKEIWKGPGITDMKGGLLILLTALKGFEKTKHAENIGWNLVINGDEEIGSPLSQSIIKKAAKGCAAAFLFEPAFPDGGLVSSRKGSLNLIIRAKGLAAHAGRDLTSGKNAIVILASLIESFKDTPGINFGEIKGGHAFNIVPDQAELKINLRSEKESLFKKFFDRLDIFAEQGNIEWVCTSYRPPKPLDKATKKLLKSLGYPCSASPSGGVCDGNHVAAMGIPTIDTLGAVGGKIHTEDEYVEVESLQERADLFLKFLIKISDGSIDIGET